MKWVTLDRPPAATPAEAEAARRLRQAVRGRNVVEFRYAGVERRVEPYAVFRGPSGRLYLDGWGGGFSRAGSANRWRRFRLDRVQGPVRVRRDTFEPLREGFNPAADAYAGGLSVAAGLTPAAP